MNFERTELHQQVVQALIETGAVNFEAMGSVFSKFAQDAATRGEGMTLIVNKFTTLACGPDRRAAGRAAQRARQSTWLRRSTCAATR